MLGWSHLGSAPSTTSSHRAIGTTRLSNEDMDYGSIKIVTPYDNPVQFDPDWRNALATAAVDYPKARVDPLYQQYLNDPWVKRQIEYLRLVRRGRALSKRHNALRLASTWYQGSEIRDVKMRIEPLLLTAATYGTICEDIGGGMVPTEVFEAYEKLYFNVRDAEGALTKSCQLRQFFALPEGTINRDTPVEKLWKMVGALMGYDTLVTMWLWGDASGLTSRSSEYMLNEMWRVAQSRLFMHIFSDRVGHESLAKLLSAFTSQAKMLHDSSSGTGQQFDTAKALMTLLSHTRPTVIGAAAVVDSVPDLTAAIKAKLSAQKNIEAQEVDDLGEEEGKRMLDAAIAKHFDNEQQMEEQR